MNTGLDARLTIRGSRWSPWRDDVKMTHNSEKYEELRQEFLRAAADYDGLGFLLSIERSASREDASIATGRYEVVCHTEWPFGRWRRCAVLAPCTGAMKQPYFRLMELAANSWLFLPPFIRQAAFDWMPDAALWRTHGQAWLGLLWLRYFVENHGRQTSPPGPAGADIEPFAVSAGLIHDWNLNTDVPRFPSWLAGRTNEYDGEPSSRHPTSDGGKRRTGDGARRRRGPRGPRMDAKQDQRLCEGWEASGYRVMADYARKELGITDRVKLRNFRRAVERHQKRRARRNNRAT